MITAIERAHTLKVNRARARRSAWREAGRCARCGDAVVEGRVRCAVCLERSRVQNRSYRTGGPRQQMRLENCPRQCLILAALAALGCRARCYQVARRAGMSARNVAVHVAQLERRGMVERERPVGTHPRLVLTARGQAALKYLASLLDIRKAG